MIFRALLVLTAIVAACDVCRTQGSAGTGGGLEPRMLVDMPTAGMARKGHLLVDVSVFQEGGVFVSVGLGIFERLSAAVSYGGSGLIGGNDPSMNTVPGVAIKARILEESVALPALAVGFDSQGKDGYIKELHRYKIKSPGFYGVISKNYSFLGYLSLHGGVNYSLERFDGDTDINCYGGVEKTLGPFLSLVVEYNLGLNDNEGNARGVGRGYLNAAVAWSLGGGATLIVNFKDVAGNSESVAVGNRTLRLEYVRPL
jgi:hypothetical protein